MSRDITMLHPCVRMIAEALVKRCAAEGYTIKVTDCVRTKEEQDSLSSLVTQVQYPNSLHNWGVAFDICQNVKGNAYPSDNAWWNEVGKIGQSLGLEWGGAWKGFVDRPHFQLNTYGNTTMLLQKYGTPEKFFAHSDFNVQAPTEQITQKSSGSDIIWLQTRLNCLGASLVIDGIWGSKTTQAVKDWYQKAVADSFNGTALSKENLSILSE